MSILEYFNQTFKNGAKVYSFFSQVNEMTSLFNEKDIEKTLWKGQRSDKSWSFKDECIKKIFGITSPFFEKHYNQVINGKGNEKAKINKLHSSSLAALMCFYKVSKEQPLNIRINDINFEFTEVKFEHENKVFEDKDRGKSSIDVALYGTATHNGETNKAVLYLESKFSEYLKRTKCSNISKLYRTHYDRIFSFAESNKECIDASYGENYINKDGQEVFDLKSNSRSRPHYCKGLKQMISHYIGACNSDDLQKGYEVYLGSVVFDFTASGIQDTSAFNGILKDYQAEYRKLCNALNKYEINGSRVKVLPTILTYQQIFKDPCLIDIDPKVSKYYNF